MALSCIIEHACTYTPGISLFVFTWEQGSSWVCLEVVQVYGNIEPHFSQDGWAGPCVAGAPIALALDHEHLPQFVIQIA